LTVGTSALGFPSKTFQPPTRVGIDYMLSTENITLVDPEKASLHLIHLM